MDLSLRPYQEKIIAELRQSFAKGVKSICLVAPTGSGKTVMFSFMAKNAALRGNRVLILTHRDELLNQSSLAFEKIGIPHGIIARGVIDTSHLITVASVQTLSRRLGQIPLDFQFLIVDEAHLYRAESFFKVIEAVSSKAKTLACTATPIRLDGRGLGRADGGFCDEMVIGPSVKSLINDGYLSPVRVFSTPMKASLEGVKKLGGDFMPSQLETAMNRPSVTGDAVEHYLRIAPGEKAIAFCTTIKHAEAVSEAFGAAGVQSRAIHGNLSIETRRAELERFRAGKTLVITSVDLITTGTDIPEVSVGIWLRPTESLTLWLQGCGRILRTAEGKSRATILDHVGNAIKHGLPQEHREWSLTTEKKRRGNVSEAESVSQCRKCFTAWSKEESDSCPECGHLPEPKPKKPIKELKGSLSELSEEEAIKRREAIKTAMRGAKSLSDLEKIAKQFNYKRGWAYHQAKLRRLK